MDLQLAFNIVIMITGSLGGWVLKWIGDSLKSLRETNTSLSEKVHHIELLMTGNYARKEDVEKATIMYRETLDNFTTAIFKKLDKIEEKLDQKVDK